MLPFLRRGGILKVDFGQVQKKEIYYNFGISARDINGLKKKNKILLVISICFVFFNQSSISTKPRFKYF